MTTKGVKNTMITGSRDKEMKELPSFFFPDHGIAIQANSQEEALEKLSKILNK
jgi:hypothetical protein